MHDNGHAREHLQVQHEHLHICETPCYSSAACARLLTCLRTFNKLHPTRCWTTLPSPRAPPCLFGESSLGMNYNTRDVFCTMYYHATVE